MIKMEKTGTPNPALFRTSFWYFVFQNLVTMGYVLLQAKLFSDMVSFAMEYRYAQVMWSALYLIVLTSVYFAINALLKNKTDLAKETEYQQFRENVVTSFFRQSRKKVSQFHAGEIRKNIELDAKKVAEYYCTGLPTMVVNPLFVLVTIYLFAAKSVLLGVIFMVLSALQAIPHALVSFFSYRYYDADREAQAKWTENVMAMYFGNATIKLYGLHHLFFQKFKQLNQKWDKLGRKASAAGRISEGICSFIETILQVFSYLVLGYFLLEGSVDLASGTYLLVLAPRLFAYTNSIFSVFPQIAEYKKAKKNIEKWEAVSEEKATGLTCHKIRVDSVGIQYNEVTALENFSCEIDLSKKYYIVGENGSGKTSLLECIAGLRDVDCGKILYDDREVERVGDSQFYDSFAYLPQEDAALDLKPYELFCEAGKCVEDRALETARQFGLSEENIYSTALCDLSGGERKKVYLSLVLAMENKFLFLDEPTNSLDAQSVEMLVERMEKRKKGWLVITHDTKLIQRASGATIYSL